MLLKRRVALDSVQLDEVDERIIISGIDEAAGKDTISATGSSAGVGQRITGQRRDTLDVTIKFVLNIKNGDMEARELLLEKVNGWASKGGWLTMGHRPGRQLQVMLAQAPGSGDMFNWTNEFTMVFRAYSVPYWSDVEETTVKSTTTASGQSVIDVPGNAETVAKVVVANKSGAKINKVKVSVGGNEMEFTELAMVANESLIIDHVQRQDIYFIRARIVQGNNARSVLAKRTGANDFYVSPGNNTITFTADRAVQTTVSVKGRYL